MSDYHYDAVVCAVHDGDTVTVDVDLGFSIWHRGMRVRLYGINAPELNTEAGKAARVFLSGALPVGQKVTLQSFKDRADKFGGRWLGNILDADMNLVNAAMVRAGHAKVWDGKGVKPT